MKKVLVCVAEKQRSLEAVQKAVEFCKETSSSLTVVHAIDDKVRSKSGELVRDSKEIDEAQSLVNSITKNIDMDARGEVLTEDKNIVSLVSEFARREGFDYIFVEHRNLEDRFEEMVGSFTKKLISNTSVPVVVV